MDEWLDLTSLIERTQEYIDIGLYDKASALLYRYEHVYKLEWQIHFLRSRICTEQNNFLQAIVHLQKAIKLDQNNLDCLLSIFYAYAQLNRIRKGIYYLKRAQRLYPGNELVLNAAIWLQTEMCNFGRAISLYEKNKDVLDKNPEALRNVGIAYERAGKHEQARASYRRVLQISNNFDEVRDLLADQYILIQQPSRSVALYKDHLGRSPNNIKSLSRLVFCLVQNNQMDEAERIAEHTIALYPNSPVGYVDRAYIYLNIDKLNRALDYVNIALDVSPIDPEAMRVKAVILSEKGYIAEAERFFEAAHSVDPENPEIIRDYYQHLRDSGKHAKMLELVYLAIEHEKPYCVEDYWFLADYYRELGNKVKSFHYLRKAYKSMPGESELIPPMADILIEKGHVSYAIPFIKRYVESKGWNDIMKSISNKRQLREKGMQEGMRFLRYCGEKPIRFREFVFGVYFRKFILTANLIIAPVFLLFSAMLFKTTGLIFSSIIILASITFFQVTHFVIQKNKISYSSPPKQTA